MGRWGKVWRRFDERKIDKRDLRGNEEFKCEFCATFVKLEEFMGCQRTDRTIKNEREMKILQKSIFKLNAQFNNLKEVSQWKIFYFYLTKLVKKENFLQFIHELEDLGASTGPWLQFFFWASLLLSI